MHVMVFANHQGCINGADLMGERTWTRFSAVPCPLQCKQDKLMQQYLYVGGQLCMVNIYLHLKKNIFFAN